MSHQKLRRCQRLWFLQHLPGSSSRLTTELLPLGVRTMSQRPTPGSQLVPPEGEGAGGSSLVKGKGLHLDQLFSN